MAEQQQDVDTLKRRGRRRLVGAIALVLLAVIVLPMVFDPEPRPVPPVSVRIPGEDDTPFKPKAVPPKPETATEQYIIAVGAFANAEGVLAKLMTAKIPYYTETAGDLTRVRAGPFASKEAAEQALQKLKGLGLQPGAVTTKG
jgi:cell division septation protein DedD